MAEGGQIDMSTLLIALTLKKKEGEDSTIFKCGTEIFALSPEDLVKVPYLEAISKGHFKENPNKSGAIDLNETICKPILMKAVVNYIKRGRERCLFTTLPDDANPTELFKFLDYLGVKKPSFTLVQLNEQLKNIVTIRGGLDSISADRSTARDACVLLCWIGKELVTDFKEQSKMDNLIMFIMSHPRAYYVRLRRLTLAWYLETFDPTPKQIANLQGWLIRCPDNPNSLSTDESSSDGSSCSSFGDCNYDSDDYCGYSS